jgi:hypothetical protein
MNLRISAIVVLFAALGAATGDVLANQTYATPLCPRPAGCVSTQPLQPNIFQPTTLYFAMFSGFPFNTRASIQTSIQGSSIVVSGTYLPCNTVCNNFDDPPPYDVFTTLPILPAGHYTVQLLLRLTPPIQMRRLLRLNPDRCTAGYRWLVPSKFQRPRRPQ